MGEAKGKEGERKQSFFFRVNAAVAAREEKTHRLTNLPFLSLSALLSHLREVTRKVA